jgi:peptidyl-Lys metalloendopeptidase
MQNQTFECRLTVADGYRLGEPIVVGFEIRNIGGETCRILTWDTPLGGDPLNFLTVTRDDVALQYDGRLVRRGDPVADDYITLEPGASRSVKVDISRLYPIDLPGEYAATLTTTLVDAFPVTEKTDPITRSRPEHQSHPLDETSVMFVVESGDAPKMTAGQAARLAELERAGGLAVRSGFTISPVIIGGTKKQRADTLAAHWGMISQAAKAHNQLTTTSIGANADYLEWFGKDGKAFFFGGPNRSMWVKLTFDHLRNIPNQAFPFPTYDLTCTSNDFAYTYYGNWTIWLCKLYKNAPLTGFESKRDTLTHEWSHARGYTQDHVRGVTEAHKLALNDPGRAINSADNYAYFSESV